MLAQQYNFLNGVWRFHYQIICNFIPQIGSDFTARPRLDGKVEKVLHLEIRDEFLHTITLCQCNDFASNSFNQDFLDEWGEFKEFEGARKIDHSASWRPDKGFSQNPYSMN